MAKKSIDNDTIRSIIGEGYGELHTLFKETKKDSEYEFIFFSKRGRYLSQERYINLLKYMNVRKTNQKLEVVGPIDTLDIIYTDPLTNTSYRASIEGKDTINQYMKKVELWRNHVIFSTFVNLASEKKDKNITIMKKIKDIDKTIDVDELDFRARLSKELDLSGDDMKILSKIPHTARDKIIFRLKQRVSLYVKKTEKDFIRIDLTMAKTTPNFRRLNTIIPSYELEIEYGCTGTPNDDSFEQMIKETETMMKIIYMTNYIIGNTKMEEIINNYKRIAGSMDLTALDARQPISLEVQHVTEHLPDRYAVTDKADGDRYFMLIMNKAVYLLSTNLNPKDTGIRLPTDEYDGTIMDGEYIFIPKYNRHLFMVFDCLYARSTDIRSETSLLVRLSKADEIISKCFIFGKQKGYIANNYKSTTNEFDLNGIVKYHEGEIKRFMDAIDHDIVLEKQFPLIRRKYFIPCLGGKKWEIFRYASLIWNKYREDDSIKCPYLLDGLIFQPLEQAYVTSVKESKLSDFKWKPADHNSIDFYIQFEKDPETNTVVTIFDNSHDEYVKNKPYRICKLYVGKRIKGKEQPVLFMESDEAYLAYLFVENGEARDIDGNLISDGTVVEFYYNNNPDVPPKFRWIPMRTRYDKTEAVLKYGRKYGNYIDIANKVWRSIINPVTMADFDDLSKGNNPQKNIYSYDRKMESLRNKIGHELIKQTAQENKYYQIKSRLATDMRQFHNWIKSNMIYTFCHPMYQSNKQLSVLDIGCGRGGDIMKFYYAMASFYVGIDLDLEGLISAVDGAVSRYNQLRRSHPNFPKMYFIQADGRALLNYDEQMRALNGMTRENRQMIEKFFPKEVKNKTQFDRINCQFAIHYFLKDETTWSNFKQNINESLRNGGYFMATAFDARTVVEVLSGTGVYGADYTDDRGKTAKLFEIIKKYDNIDTNKPLPPGLAIDLHGAWMFMEGTYQTEYLVDSQFIIPDLLKDCDLELVDTDLFKNQLEIHRDYFANYAKYEENVETNAFLAKVGKFYEKGEINDNMQKYNHLMRYYVFRKKDNSTKREQKGGFDFSSSDQFVVPNMKQYNNDYSMMNSIHHLLKSHHIIPKTITSPEFYKDIGIDMVNDVDVDNTTIQRVCKNLLIENVIDGGARNQTNKAVLNGVHALLIERDCNDEYFTSFISKNNDRKSRKNDRVILLMKEGDLYKPVYKVDGDRRKGLFRISDPFIAELLNDY